VYYCDEDGDGVRSVIASGFCATWQCVPGGCLEEAGTDCDDQRPEVRPGADEVCNGIDDDCSGGADGPGVCPERVFHCDRDEDGDFSLAASGSCESFQCIPAGCREDPGTDCNDRDPAIHVGVTETCNGVDDDCSGGADGPGVCPDRVFHCDRDGDGVASVAASGTCHAYRCVPEGCQEMPGADCDDGRSDIHPGAIEVCNGVDDDCSGETDEGEACPLTVFYCDRDQDGFRALAPSGTCRGEACVPWGCMEDPGDDCDDRDPAVHPGAVETCNGRDDDCDGQPDPPGVCPDRVFYCDRDGDGVVSLEESGHCGSHGCVPAGCQETPGQDCDDHDPQVLPGAGEDCGTPWDDDCDGATDFEGARGCRVFGVDGDGDGFFADHAEMACRCVPVAPFTGTAGGDCNDDRSEVHPGAVEVCNGVDDDCDGDVDNQGQCLVVYYCDLDGDFYLSASPSGACPEFGCMPEGCRAVPGRDCDDANPAVHPGVPEDCDTPWDDDCNGSADAVGAPHCQAFHRDLDRDGHGHPGLWECRCLPRVPFLVPADQADDCNDNDSAVYPGAVEVCNGLDDDCDSVADGPGVCPVTSFWCDQDRDGTRSSTVSGTCNTWQCLPADCGILPGSDCDDHDPAVHPGAVEVCNGLDDDCDGVADGSGICPVQVYWCDRDGDGYRSSTVSGTCETWRCVPAGCGTEPGDDCADGHPAIHPGAVEACDGIDNDCNGVADPPGTCPRQTWFCDGDQDGFPSDRPSGSCDWFGCVPPDCATAPGSDCDDGDSLVHPGAPETCNGLDDDCDGQRDGPGVCPTWAFHCDQDRDGFLALAPTGTCQFHGCVPVGCSLEPGPDCDDGRPTIRPGAPEVCNGTDDDCNGVTDEGTCWIDGGCVDAGRVHPQDPCRWCDPAVDPGVWSPADGRPCDDGRSWTVNDVCASGTCSGVLPDCFGSLTFGDALRTQTLLVGDDGNPGEGLDVDGNPATCQPQGSYPDGRPQCSAGIDNKAALVDEVVNQELPGALTSGSVHLILEFRGFRSGGTPEVFFYQGEKEDPACNHRLPGCAYRVPASAFDGACRPRMTLAPVTRQGDRVRAGGPGSLLPLSMPLVGSTVLSVTLYHAAMDGTLSTDGAGRIVSFQGILAGAMRKADLFAALEQVPDDQLPVPRDQILILLNLLLRPDIDTDGDGNADAISLGLKATADAAILSGVTIP